jgi:hypothetical protein
MFNLGALAANVLNSLDNAAKDTLEEPKISATALRSQRQSAYNNESDSRRSDDEDNDEEEQPVQVVVSSNILARLVHLNLPEYVNPYSLKFLNQLLDQGAQPAAAPSVPYGSHRNSQTPSTHHRKALPNVGTVIVMLHRLCSHLSFSHTLFAQHNVSVGATRCLTSPVPMSALQATMVMSPAVQMPLAVAGIALVSLRWESQMLQANSKSTLYQKHSLRHPRR